MSTTKTTTYAALVLAAGLALTACSSTPEVEQPALPTTPVVEQTQAPEPTAPEETPAPVVEAPKTGAIVTAEPADLEPSQKAFPLADGTFVIVDRYEPLPEAVQAAVQATAEAGVTYEAGVTDYSGVAAQTQAINATKSAIITSTGKNVVVVYRMVGAEGCNGLGADPWTFTGATADQFNGCAGWATGAEALAAAQQYVAGRQDANTFVVLVDNA